MLVVCAECVIPCCSGRGMLVAPRSRSRSCVRYGWGVGEAGVVIQAYRFALDPTPGQDAVLRSHCGGQRFAFNWGLALVTAVVEQRTAEASYGCPG